MEKGKLTGVGSRRKVLALLLFFGMAIASVAFLMAIEQSSREILVAETQTSPFVPSADADQQKEIDALRKELEAIKNQAPKTIVREAPKGVLGGSDQDYSNIAAEWKDRVAQVTCAWDDSSGGLPILAGGSALLVGHYDKYELVAITNKHVITDAYGAGPSRCGVALFGGGYRIASDQNATGNPFLISRVNDRGLILLDDAFLQGKSEINGLFEKAISTEVRECSETDVSLGDRLIVLGYPVIGTEHGITITEGIISGFEDNYYVTSAKIDHGNSGGAAVLVKSDCYLGIPTFAKGGTIESLGRILKSDLYLKNE